MSGASLCPPRVLLAKVSGFNDMLKIVSVKYSIQMGYLQSLLSKRLSIGFPEVWLRATRRETQIPFGNDNQNKDSTSEEEAVRLYTFREIQQAE